jgi:hypothetical protein
VDLIEALNRLEAAAAVVEALLPLELTEAQLLELSDGWGPPPRGNGHRPKVAAAETWLAWIRSCAGRWEERRPVEPELTADDLHRVIVKWVCDTSSGPA